ncbi:probable serine incorporator isoform X2 [Daktulosphaira vitifoliae]|uniref:probable serine incorporator isoform X2 n=1 Tax=Daktulosphaira vitifoliae TaxID=58002 RepID=UPI0021A9B585|nr:probable serine incorporator isoform X2 [Daktulosphaira vitifoliae]
MGALLSLCTVGQMACCCGQAACSLFACCPSCGNSTSTKVMYGLMLLVAVILSCITLAPGLQSFLQKVPFCENAQASSITGKFVNNLSSVSIDCKNAVGYMAVYRICFAMFIFFSLMSFIMIGVKDSRDRRAPIQNGFWGIKYIIVLGGIIGSFFIAPEGFSHVWMICGMIGGFIYLILQFVQVLDSAHSLAESWLYNWEQTENKKWYFALLITTVVCYGLAIAGIFVMFHSFTQGDGCGLNKFFITLTIVICIFMSSISITSCVQRVHEKSGLLQSSIVSLYVVYLTWSALSSGPESQCNQSLTTIFNKSDPNASKIHFGSENLVSIGIFVLFVLYSAIKTGSSSKFSMSVSTEKSNDSDLEGGHGDSSNGKIFDDEKEEVAYSWSFYHFTFAMATLFLMMTLTNWYSPNSSLDNLHPDYASTWTKILSCWICAGLYVWTLVAPIVLPDREF